MLRFLFVCIICVTYTAHPLNYGQKAALAYVESNHGPDGKLFLDPYFQSEIENLNNSKVLDAGCGAAPWSIYAAKQGGIVYAIDIQKEMILEAKKAIKAAHLSDKITLTQGDVCILPFETDFFDVAMSICVACNLSLSSFEKHFSECLRTLKRDGTLVVAAPFTLDVVFSNSSKKETEVLSHIENVLREMPKFPTPEMIREHLNQLTEVLSASFHIKEGYLTLVSDKSKLEEGTEIWRKLPTLVVPNYYYSLNHYLNIFRKCGFSILRIDRPQFKSEKERLAYNAKSPPKARLGRAYSQYAPFIIFHIKKV